MPNPLADPFGHGDDFLNDEQEMDYLDSLAQSDDGSPDTPFGSHSSTMRTLTLTAPPLKLSSVAQDALGGQAPMPIQGKPKLWQRIAAGAIGGAAGLVNAGGRVHVNAQPAIEGVYAGNTPYEQAKWSQERQRLAQAAQMEQQQNAQAVAGYRAQTAQQDAGSRALAAESLARKNDATAAATLAPKWGATTGGIFHDRTGEFKSTGTPPVLKVSPGQGVQNKDGTFSVPVPKVEKPIDPLDSQLKQARIAKLKQPASGRSVSPDVTAHKEERQDRQKLKDYTTKEYDKLEKRFSDELKGVDSRYRADLGKATGGRKLEIEGKVVNEKQAIESAHKTRKEYLNKQLAEKWKEFDKPGGELEAPDSIEAPAANPYRQSSIPANPYRRK